MVHRWKSSSRYYSRIAIFKFSCNSSCKKHYILKNIRNRDARELRKLITKRTYIHMLKQLFAVTIWEWPFHAQLMLWRQKGVEIRFRIKFRIGFDLGLDLVFWNNKLYQNNDVTTLTDCKISSLGVRKGL